MSFDPLSIIAHILKLLLYPLSILYGIGVWLRNKAYNNNWYSSIEFDTAVIAVGNLSTGGTGKSPHIEYLIRLLQYEYKIGTQSRGYKRRSHGFLLGGLDSTAYDLGDEPMQFKLKFPEVAVSVCEDRMTGIPELLAKRPDVEVVLLDDAFQHRSVKAGLNILITDFNQPFYKDFILPFGNLREQRSSYKRADAIIVSKCPADIEEQQMQTIIHQIQPLPEQKIFFSKIKYGNVLDFFSRVAVPWSNLGKVVLVCGIANPAPMLEYVKQRVGDVHLLKYADHHYFTSYNMEEIKQTCENWKNEKPVILTTEKDAVRLALKKEQLLEWEIQVYVLPIEIEFIKDKDVFDDMVKTYVQSESKYYKEHGFEELLY
ncbi:MAG TPA: tetraacyldisaccharide 4'-kinase [Edaphocola sp.]|nr:tetraacyldisaccharide 4'-kinase [Edaphocola sp.]